MQRNLHIFFYITINFGGAMDNGVKEKARQVLHLVSRSELSLDGVVDVKSFDDMTVTLETNMGLLSVEGKQLRITKFLMQTGEISIDGVIDALVFAEAEKEKRGFFSRLAR